MSPKPQAGALAGARIAVDANSPGNHPDLALRDAFAADFTSAGLDVVTPDNAPTPYVEVSQPLGEWSGAYAGEVLTYSDAKHERLLAERAVHHECASPNAADHAVATWLSDPKVTAALDRPRP